MSIVDRAARVRVRRRGQLDQRLVERLLEAVVLLVRTGGDATRRAMSGRCRIGERSSPSAFQWSTASVDVEQLDLADHLVERAEAELGHELADLLGDEVEEVHDELGVAGELLAQLRVLGGDARPGRC